MHILSLVTDNNLLNESAEGRRMTVEIISWSISTKVWDRTGIKLATPESAVRHASVARHVTNCATQPGRKEMVVEEIYYGCFSTWPSLMCEWNDFCSFWVAIMSEALLKFLLKRIYGLEEYVVWIIPRWLFSEWPSLMCEWDDLCYFWVAIMSEALLKFLLKRIYGLEEDVGWRIPRWL